MLIQWFKMFFFFRTTCLLDSLRLCQCIYTYKFPWKCVLICCGFSVPYRSFEKTARAPRHPGERDGISLPFSFQRSLSPSSLRSSGARTVGARCQVSPSRPSPRFAYDFVMPLWAYPFAYDFVILWWAYGICQYFLSCKVDITVTYSNLILL